MPQFSASDLAAFFDVDDFGVTATYKAGGVGGGVAVRIIFTNNYVAFTGGTVDIEGTYPVALCKTTDISGVAHDDTLLIDSVTYKVIGVQPSSTTGTTKLIMNEV